jgi:hypothetical protein
VDRFADLARPEFASWKRRMGGILPRAKFFPTVEIRLASFSVLLDVKLARVRSVGLAELLVLLRGEFHLPFCKTNRPIFICKHSDIYKC